MLLVVASYEGCLIQFLAEPIDNLAAIRAGECIIRLILGGHFRFAERVIDLAPLLNIKAGQQVWIQLIDSESALGLLGTMTVHAALRQDRFHRLLIVNNVGLWDRIAG